MGTGKAEETEGTPRPGSPAVEVGCRCDPAELEKMMPIYEPGCPVHFPLRPPRKELPPWQQQLVDAVYTAWVSGIKVTVVIEPREN